MLFESVNHPVATQEPEVGHVTMVRLEYGGELVVPGSGAVEGTHVPAESVSMRPSCVPGLATSTYPTATQELTDGQLSEVTMASLEFAGSGAVVGVQVPPDSVSKKLTSLRLVAEYEPIATQAPTAGQVTVAGVTPVQPVKLGGFGSWTDVQDPPESVTNIPCTASLVSKYVPRATHDPTAGHDKDPMPSCGFAFASTGTGATVAVHAPADSVSKRLFPPAALNPVATHDSTAGHDSAKRSRPSVELKFDGRGASVGVQIPADSVSITPSYRPAVSRYEPMATQEPSAGQLRAERLLAKATLALAGRGACTDVQFPPESSSIKPLPGPLPVSPKLPTATHDPSAGQDTALGRRYAPALPGIDTTVGVHDEPEAPLGSDAPTRTEANTAQIATDKENDRRNFRRERVPTCA
jgi:hypothetical protein